MKPSGLENELLLYAADALCMPLQLDENGKYRSATMKNLKLGPWGALPSEVSVCSDVIEDNEASFFIRITSSLWIYLISYKDGMEAVVFNGKKLRWRVQDMLKVGGVSVNDTIALIAPAQGDTFVFEKKTQAWRKVDANVVDQGLTIKNSDSASSGTEVTS